MKYDVFISYSRRDTPIADKICAALDQQGITYFIDRKGIGGGMEFPAVLADAIINSRIMLFLGSENSYKSKFSNSEVTFAFNEKESGSIIPYIIDGSTLPPALKLTFSSINIRTLQEHPIETVLVKDLCQILGRPYVDIEKKRKEEQTRIEEQKRAEEERRKIGEEKRKIEEEAKRLPEKKKAENLQSKQQQKRNKPIENVKGKLLIAGIMVVFIGVGLLVNKSCGNSDSIKMYNDVDSLSYAIGMAQTEGLMEYLSETMKVDTALMDYFIRGFQGESMPSKDNQKKAYVSGSSIRLQMDDNVIPGINHEAFGDDSTRTISCRLFYAGFIDGIEKDYHIMGRNTASQTASQLLESIKDATLQAQYGENKKKGEEFLKENALKDGVVTLPGGTQYRVIKEGVGPIPSDSSLVTVNYEGKTIDGTVFDSSYIRDVPATLRCNQVIIGWTDVLTRMPSGSVWEVYIPQERAYGNREQGTIKPFSALIFKIELLETK